MTRKQTVVLTLLSIAAMLLAMLVSRRIWFRLDLTGSRAYTISKVSRNLRAEIPDEVRITYYLSDKLKSIHPMPAEIEDLLREYAAYSGGKIRLIVKDPVKANLAEQVERLGIRPEQIETVQRDQASLMTIYSGITIEYLDKIEVLPLVFSLDTLEYDLTSRIRSLTRDAERRIGIVIGDSFRQWNQDYRYLNQALAEAGYRTRLIPPGDEIPDTLPALFVLGGAEELDNRALYQIDHYIQKGGRVLFAVEGIYVDTVNGTLEARRLDDAGLLEMIASYGVTVRPELALDRSALTLQYQTRTPGGSLQFRIIRYPHWIGVLGENGDREHPVSVHSDGLDLFWSSPLEFHLVPGVEARELFASTGDAWVMRDEFYTSPEAAYLFERGAAETQGKKILGASLGGIFPGWFRGQSMPDGGDPDRELPGMPAEGRPSRIIVIGDTDFATDIINATGARRNLDFLLRAADWLGSDDDIIGIRNRESAAGRLDRVSSPEKKAALMRFVQFINVILVPLLLVAAGILFAWRRGLRSRTGAKEHSNDV